MFDEKRASFFLVLALDLARMTIFRSQRRCREAKPLPDPGYNSRPVAGYGADTPNNKRHMDARYGIFNMGMDGEDRGVFHPLLQGSYSFMVRA